MYNAMIISPSDNVAVAIEPIVQGGNVTYLCGESAQTLTALEDITIYHKLAVRDIAEGEPVCKYGEHIGVASRFIRAGEHVHVHNVEGRREDLAAKE